VARLTERARGRVGFTWRTALLTASVAFVTCVPVVFALPKYREQTIRQLHYEGPLWSRKTMECTFCHVKRAGGAPWNAFGEAIKAGFREAPKAGFDEVLFAVLSKQLDSDADGYTDALEVFARTLPGDAKSKPAEGVQELERRLDAAGGVQQYRPKDREAGGRR